MFTSFLQQHHTIIVILHALAGAIGVGSAVVLDLLFFYFLKDFKISQSENKVASLISSMFIVTLSALYITGLLLFLSNPDLYGTSTKFLTKVAVVLVLSINGLFLHNYISPRMRALNFQKYNPEKKFLHTLAFAAGSISIASWVIAYVLGTQKTIPFSLLEALMIYAGIVLVGILVSIFTLQHMKKQGVLHVKDHK